MHTSVFSIHNREEGHTHTHIDLCFEVVCPVHDHEKQDVCTRDIHPSLARPHYTRQSGPDSILYHTRGYIYTSYTGSNFFLDWYLTGLHMLPRHGVGLCRLVLSTGQYGARAPKRHSSTLKPALAVRTMPSGTPSKSDEHAPVPVRPGVRARHFIRSLAPSELTAGDWGDLSLLGDKMVTVDDKASGKQAALRVNYASDGGRPVLFPAGTAGFFYLHMPDSAHPIGAHLRFRLVAAPDPAMFAAGRDLCTPSGPDRARWLPTAGRRRRARPHRRASGPAPGGRRRPLAGCKRRAAAQQSFPPARVP
jgi:hypothetical protein